MANYACRHGHTWKGRSSLSAKFNPAELMCPECGSAADPKANRSGAGLSKPEPLIIAEAHTRRSTAARRSLLT